MPAYKCLYRSLACCPPQSHLLMILQVSVRLRDSMIGPSEDHIDGQLIKDHTNCRSVAKRDANATACWSAGDSTHWCQLANNSYFNVSTNDLPNSCQLQLIKLGSTCQFGVQTSCHLPSMSMCSWSRRYLIIYLIGFLEQLANMLSVELTRLLGTNSPVDLWSGDMKRDCTTAKKFNKCITK